MTCNIYDLDHALELQLTVKALTDAGFCQAWSQIANAWKVLDPKANVKSKMKDEFTRAGALKTKANDPQMLFFVDTAFNEAVCLFNVTRLSRISDYSFFGRNRNVLGWQLTFVDPHAPQHLSYGDIMQAGLLPLLTELLRISIPLPTIFSTRLRSLPYHQTLIMTPPLPRK